MGGCASKPKDSHVEPLDENPTSPKQIPKNVDGDLSVENRINSVEKQNVENEHEEEKQKVENEHKEEPLPVSSPMPDAAAPAEDSTAKEQSTVIVPVSDITGSNSDAPQDLEKDSDDPQKVSEIIHYEEKTGVVNETADQPKKDIDQAQDSQTTETATKGTEIEPEMQKLHVQGEGPSPNSEALKDSPTSVTSA
ncbi:hypothetical protein AAC387_Pa01g3465 [Persea americana]